MRLNKINKPSADELFAKAIEYAKPSQRRVITFYELPKIVQDKILSRWPYEEVREVVELPINKGEDETVFVGGPQAQVMFVIKFRDHLEEEQAFWPNGNSIEWVDEDERFPEESEEDHMTDEELAEYHKWYEQELRKHLDDARRKNERQ